MIIKEVLAQLEQATGPVVKMLRQGEGFKMKVLGFKKGMILKEHTTAVSTRIVIVEGQVEYKEGERFIMLSKFDDIEIPVNVPHSVEALADSICLLVHG
jgi:quercetin dioxygenase-like cupin family protein